MRYRNWRKGVLRSLSNHSHMHLQVQGTATIPEHRQQEELRQRGTSAAGSQWRGDWLVSAQPFQGLALPRSYTACVQQRLQSCCVAQATHDLLYALQEVRRCSVQLLQAQFLHISSPTPFLACHASPQELCGVSRDIAQPTECLILSPRCWQPSSPA